MEDKIFYVVYRGLNVAWYNTLEDALEEATERYYNWGRRRLEVVDFPVVVVIDSLGNNLYESGRREYLAAKKVSFF